MSEEHVGISRRNLLAATGLVGAGIAGAAAAGSQAAAQAATSEATSQAQQNASPPTDNLDFSLPTDNVDPAERPLTDSTFFSTVFIEQAGSYAATTSDGDLWANCWADDGNIYAANGDGRGFSSEPFKDVVVNRIYGTPETGITGEKLAESEDVANVWGDPSKYNRKPTGMVCARGVLYLAVQDLRYGDNAFDDSPNASISSSTDHGKTWHKTSSPMFTDHRFTTIFFADFGKNSEQATRALGRTDGHYVYAYGMDWNWRASITGTVPNPIALYLARVPDDAVQNRSAWRFFAGTDQRGRPQWAADIADKQPVLQDSTRRYPDPITGQGGNLSVISQGGVLYHPVFDRFIYTSWTNPSFEFYEAPTPWGPWRRFAYQNEGLTTWYRRTDPTHTPKNGGYATTLPSKFVSADGQDLWLQSNWWEAPAPTPADNYNFNLRRVRLTRYQPSTPNNRRNAKDNLARSGQDATVIQISLRDANYRYLNDGNLTLADDSYDGTNKLFDYWGYTFSRSYRMNRVVYVTGAMAADGGWFSRYAGGIRVQVRQNFRWIDVGGLRVLPDYPYDASAGPNHTYRFDFAETWGDGVRIVGQPDGSSHYTSIAELEVYYA